MKVLSVRQPYASLIAHGLKHFETRSWRTRHRGPLLIHASAIITGVEWNVFFTPGVYPHLEALGFTGLEQMPRGHIIAQVNLAAVHPAQALGYEEELYALASPIEFKIGNFDPGRFAWHLTDPIIFPNPIAHVGQTGLWSYRSHSRPANVAG